MWKHTEYRREKSLQVQEMQCDYGQGAREIFLRALLDGAIYRNW